MFELVDLGGDNLSSNSGSDRISHTSFEFGADGYPSE